ncbi:hypothetical protein DDB_G0274849 [Dictyostelium discoideum AX4]|uniref:Uncharacterized protein n=1 Tax=Dictyostelium discoideum TaxID=44689 RepID=Q555M7_DICDI|nr:hypothetical protein DDB_G0274849 [Dictyostelium discoideum AX4]EAL70317.1 hypothetical protein DDB_G0274849 [Dictyostelium discoideum AX4]|eukprot:XP_644039.1 hypothetical protein DDB_G0274849 [Dictyostelium discoideum AX4]
MNKFRALVLIIIIIFYSNSVLSEHKYNQCYMDCLENAGCSQNMKKSDICNILTHECNLNCDN